MLRQPDLNKLNPDTSTDTSTSLSPSTATPLSPRLSPSTSPSSSPPLSPSHGPSTDRMPPGNRPRGLNEQPGGPHFDSPQSKNLATSPPTPTSVHQAQMTPHPATDSSRSSPTTVDIQQELNRLEEMILDSPRVPLTRRTLIDEEQILAQLDLVRLNMPLAFQEADLIVRHREEIMQEAELYAQEIVEAAENRASQILNETGLVQQAQLESDQLRQQVQIDCESMRQSTLLEVEQIRAIAQRELEEMRTRAINEAQDVQTGADDYADRTLGSLEQQLTEMLIVVRNGRQQLGGTKKP